MTQEFAVNDIAVLVRPHLYDEDGAQMKAGDRISVAIDHILDVEGLG